MGILMSGACVRAAHATRLRQTKGAHGMAASSKPALPARLDPCQIAPAAREIDRQVATARVAEGEAAARRAPCIWCTRSGGGGRTSTLHKGRLARYAHMW